MSKGIESLPLFSCGIFKADFEALPARFQARFKTQFLDSSLHLDPEELDRQMLECTKNENDSFLLLYGDCAPHLLDIIHKGGSKKIHCVNCIELWLGTEKYRELKHRGSFFLLYEWVIRWEEIFKNKLGFRNKELAQEYMHESATELVYIDTGVQAIPRQILNEAATFLGLPLRIERVSLKRLEDHLDALYEGLT
ncbi:DUF1638 domain-containing protein [Treponema sp.]